MHLLGARGGGGAASLPVGHITKVVYGDNGDMLHAQVDQKTTFSNFGHLKMQSTLATNGQSAICCIKLAQCKCGHPFKLPFGCTRAPQRPKKCTKNQRQVLGQVGRDLHVSQQHLPRWPWLAKQRFLGFVFEKQWTSLALPATGLQFLAGNGPFLALSQTRPAAAPHLQHPNGPP